MGASNFRRKLRHNSRGRKTLVGVRWHSSFQIPQRQRDAGNKNQDRQREKYAPPLLSGFLLVFFSAAQVPFLAGENAWAYLMSDGTIFAYAASYRSWVCLKIGCPQVSMVMYCVSIIC